MAKDSRCTRCGSFDLKIVWGDGIGTTDDYVCLGCGLHRKIEAGSLMPEGKEPSLIIEEPQSVLTIEERAMVELLEIAEDRRNEPLVRIEACKVILGR